jgi:hypothetical protein
MLVFALIRLSDMKNRQITTRLSVIAVIASSLLAIGIVTALSMVAQADALTLSNSGSAAATGGNGEDGADGADGGDGEDATAIIKQRCRNFCG